MNPIPQLIEAAVERIGAWLREEWVPAVVMIILALAIYMVWA